MASTWTTPHSQSPPGIGDGGEAAAAVPDVAEVTAACARGVRVQWLVQWTVAHNIWTVPTWKVVDTLIKPTTQERRCRFVDLEDGELKVGVENPGDDPVIGEADAFISHAWANNWGELVTAAQQFSRSGRRVWIDCMAVNQHEPAMDLELLRNVIGGVPEGLLVVINPNLPLSDLERNPLSRAWCIFELFNAMISKVPVLIKMGQMASQASQKRQRDPQPLPGSADAEGGGQTAPFFETVWDKKKVDGLVESICLSMVTASRDEDRDRILSHISQHFDDFAVEETIRNAIWAGWTSRTIPALHFAVQGTSALKESGLPLEATNPEGWTALHCAAASGLCGAVAVLLEAGADPETESSKGRTALIHAAWSGQKNTLDQLIKAGANPRAVDKWRRNAAYYTAKNRFKGQAWRDCLELLAHHGVTPPPKRAKEPRSSKTAGSKDAQDSDGFTLVAPKQKPLRNGKHDTGRRSPRPERRNGNRANKPSGPSRGFGARENDGQGRGRGRGRGQPADDTIHVSAPQQDVPDAWGHGKARTKTLAQVEAKGVVRNGVKRWASIAAGDDVSSPDM